MTSVPIGDLVSKVDTWDPRRSSAASFTYIDLSSVDAMTKTIESPVATTGAEAPSRARQLVQSGDVLVSTVRPYLNAVAQVGLQWAGATASTGFTVLRPDPRLDSRYLFHWVRTPSFIGDMVRKSTGASYPAVSDRVVKASMFPVPPLDEQRRIAAILDHADALRAKRRQVLAHLDDLTQAIFHDMFVGKGPSTTFGEVAEIQGGLQISRKRDTYPESVPYLRVANVHRGRLALEEIKHLRALPQEIERTRLLAGDLLFVEGHANPMEVGRVAVWSGALEECVHQNHLIRGRLDTSRVLPSFASAWLNSPAGAEHFRRAGRTTSGLNTISAKTVRSAPMLLPVMSEQRTFDERIRAIVGQADAVREAVARDDELFASLQSRAFRGEL